MVHKKKFLALIFVFVLMLGFLFYNPKPSIQNATITQLDSIDGIGTILSTQIYYYVQHNDIEHVVELQGHIDYLGEKRLESLKEVYK